MKRLLLAVGLTALAGPALAHTGHDIPSGFAQGVLHPLLGPDHFLAMLAVGLWSGFAMTHQVWKGASTFLAAMTAGAGLAWAGLALPLVETGIAASIVLFGLLVALARLGQSPAITNLALALIAVFAAFHGQAHAAEATGNAVSYLAGFLLVTAALLALGIGLARGLARTRQAGPAQQLLGGAIAALGLLLAVG